MSDFATILFSVKEEGYTGVMVRISTKKHYSKCRFYSTRILTTSEGCTPPMALLQQHIIIADDAEHLRNILVRIVSTAYPAARISVVADGRAALAVFEHEAADLVITNNQMPHMGGLQLIGELRQRGVIIPIIMTSGDVLIEPQAQAAGASAFLPKPSSAAEMNQVLRALLAQP